MTRGTDLSRTLHGLVPSFLVPLKAINILGVAGLRKLLEYEASDVAALSKKEWQAPALLRLSEIVDELEKRGARIGGVDGARRNQDGEGQQPVHGEK